MVVATIEPDGSSSMAAYGNPGPDAKPLDGDSVFEIGSITKVFTAILLADMVDRGEVKLDDPVAKHLRAGARVPERNGRAITLIDLSTQSSGLPRMPDNMKPANPMNPYADYTVEQLFEFLGRYQLTRDIGAEFEYSNLGVGLLGQALAMRAGKTYEALVKERILEPLRHGSHGRHADAVDAGAPGEGLFGRRHGDAELGSSGAGRRGRVAIDDERHAEVCARES